MKVLLLHADYIEWKPVKPALRSAKPVPTEWKRVEEALVVMVAVEEGDSEEKVEDVVKDVEEQYERVKPKNIVVYPWVHLTQKPAKPSLASKITELIFESLKQRGYNVFLSPFGWYKAFRISVKGHPLSELSRSF